MKWFFQLTTDEQFLLLTSPQSELPESATGARPAPFEKVTGTSTHPRPARYRLSAEAAEQLLRRRDRLTSWWQTLDKDQQRALIACRDDWLPQTFRDIVSLSEGVITESHHDPVSGECETKVYATAMTRTFLGWKAHVLTRTARQSWKRFELAATG